MNRLLTIEELSAELGISARMVRHYIRTFKVPVRRVPVLIARGNKIVADPADLYAILSTPKGLRHAR
jgi:hypothetical protein